MSLKQAYVVARLAKVDKSNMQPSTILFLRRDLLRHNADASKVLKPVLEARMSCRSVSLDLSEFSTCIRIGQGTQHDRWQVLRCVANGWTTTGRMHEMERFVCIICQGAVPFILIEASHSAERVSGCRSASESEPGPDNESSGGSFVFTGVSSVSGAACHWSPGGIGGDGPPFPPVDDWRHYSGCVTFWSSVPKALGMGSSVWLTCVWCEAKRIFCRALAVHGRGPIRHCYRNGAIS